MTLSSSPAGRPDPDALLARVAAEEAKQARGRLKIFFGMAPGVGKTYAMLEAARKVAKEGVDVIVGYVEPHARPETQALVMGLDLLQRREITRGGSTLYEFDLEAALTRHPQLILVDELAHTNAEGSTHAKRWQDIEDLLAAGIDVYTTVNVQHLESLNDVVAQVTSIPVRETVPDHVFEQADEVELVDLAPDDLIERLREGKVYVPAQARRAIENFFRKGNLIALRELSLRKTADRVNAQALDYRSENAIQRIWPTSERLLVCVSPSPFSAKLVRGARRLAGSLQAPLTALHVVSIRSPRLSSEDRQRLDQNLRLAEELGAKVDTITADRFAEGVVAYAREHNVTKIVVGKPQGRSLRDWFRESAIDELIRISDDIDIYVIRGEGTSPAPPVRNPVSRPINHRAYALALTAVAVCTAVGWQLRTILAPTNLAMLYLATVVAVSLVGGRGPSIVATIVGVAVFDIVLVPPYWTFAVTDTEYLLTFLVMLTTGLVVSELNARIRSQNVLVRQRERHTAALYSLSRELANLPTADSVAEAARRRIREALDIDVWIAISDDGKTLKAPDLSPSPLPAQDEGVARWVLEHRRPAGRGTDTLPGNAATYFPLLVTEGIVGVLGVHSRQPEGPLLSEPMQLLQAFVGQVAGAIERCGLALQAEKIRLQMETERMRNALLSAVSHDLRTPLATITGATSLLAQSDPPLPPETQRDLARSVVDEAERLHRLVTNLLDLTRLESGAIQLSRELQPIEEVIETSLARTERHFPGRPVTTEIARNLPPVSIDAILIEQVLVNLLDNADKFSPPELPIVLRAFAEGDRLVVEVEDRGPGLPSGEEQRIFEKFYRVSPQAHRGSGIGLTICRGIVELHGGTIAARNRDAGTGAVFRFTIPFAKLPEPRYAAE
ncbi:sensor histidine kinase [Planctomyces sp. SH-PL14]|uniref:sensor histidine kinase n=1 Tax=Planctomyces sp. SH-PL14 TaxID=1632864 RepID=UPI00078EEF46|nr:sensor histidine kinase KdpD [Planctomyces sp. SH-PL14]AMV19451.1 Sensor protein KdpD [Planctomyces sp. SH-PL14]